MICAPYKELIVPKKLMSPNWEKALAWLREDSWKKASPGRTEIDGTNVFAIHYSYMSKPLAECRWESHRNYADLQVGIKGAEIIQACLGEGMKPTEPYSAEKDVELLEGQPELVHQVTLAFPQAVILFPWDIHMPTLAPNDRAAEVEKFVIKVAL